MDTQNGEVHLEDDALNVMKLTRQKRGAINAAQEYYLDMIVTFAKQDKARGGRWKGIAEACGGRWRGIAEACDGRWRGIAEA